MESLNPSYTKPREVVAVTLLSVCLVAAIAACTILAINHYDLDVPYGDMIKAEVFSSEEVILGVIGGSALILAADAVAITLLIKNRQARKAKANNIFA
jgi:hypothetical protein